MSTRDDYPGRLDAWRDAHGEDLIGERCCGADCWGEDWQTPEQPCWGDVRAVDEEAAGDGDYCWVHACEGHGAMYEGGTYRPHPGAFPGWPPTEG